MRRLVPGERLCRNAARAAKNFLVFAGVPQVSRETFWRLREFRKRLGECREPRAACANVSVNAVELAQPAQTSQQMPWYLRSLRKHLGKYRGACAACANVSVNAAELARPAQTPKSFLRDLQQCCKRQKVFRGTCNSVANARKFFVGLATVLQAFPKTLWLSQCAIQDILQK